MVNEPRSDAEIPVMQPFNIRSPRKTWTPKLFGITDPPAYEATRVGSQRGVATVCWLYRFFDADKTLLYVGITVNPAGRWPEHGGQPWWPKVRFASLAAVPPKDRYAHESEAIRTEQPLYNKTQRTRPGSTTVDLSEAPDRIVMRLRARMSPAEFAALAEAFTANR